MTGVKLKICGMKTPENIRGVAALKPDYLGFIFYKGSKRYVDGLSADFFKTLPVEIKKTGVFVDEDLEKVVELVADYNLNAVQLHGDESPDYCRELKQLISSDTELIKAFGIDEGFDFMQLEAYANYADYFLFDTQTPDYGGSGKTFNWTLLKNYNLDKPYFLSGGIGLESIAQLNKIDDKRLYAIDLNSRFEISPGMKDIDKLKDFKNKLPL